MKYGGGGDRPWKSIAHAVHCRPCLGCQRTNGRCSDHRLIQDETNTLAGHVAEFDQGDSFCAGLDLEGPLGTQLVTSGWQQFDFDLV